tara:strand:+ start:379 stop:582 length:204 start_codon:yes stop_codon:yes gene_type:complete
LDPFEDLPIGLDNTSEILTETVLIQDPALAISHPNIPKAAGIRANFIGQQQAPIGAAAKLQLEVNQL